MTVPDKMIAARPDSLQKPHLRGLEWVVFIDLEELPKLKSVSKCKKVKIEFEGANINWLTLLIREVNESLSETLRRTLWLIKMTCIVKKKES